MFGDGADASTVGCTEKEKETRKRRKLGARFTCLLAFLSHIAGVFHKCVLISLDAELTCGVGSLRLDALLAR